MFDYGGGGGLCKLVVDAEKAKETVEYERCYANCLIVQITSGICDFARKIAKSTFAKQDWRHSQYMVSKDASVDKKVTNSYWVNIILFT